MNEYSQALLSYADSLFAKEKADLILLGKEDSSGIPVEERRAAAAAEHAELDYRLVPASALRDAATAFANQVAEAREQSKLLGAFMQQVPKAQWPEELRRADQFLEEARQVILRAPLIQAVDLYAVLATEEPPEPAEGDGGAAMIRRLAITVLARVGITLYQYGLWLDRNHPVEDDDAFILLPCNVRPPAGYGTDPCTKPIGHEHGPTSDWKRDHHSNGHFKWPVQHWYLQDTETGKLRLPRRAHAEEDR